MKVSSLFTSKQRYSLRKFSLGLGSVLLGSVLHHPVVQADSPVTVKTVAFGSLSAEQQGQVQLGLPHGVSEKELESCYIFVYKPVASTPQVSSVTTPEGSAGTFSILPKTGSEDFGMAVSALGLAGLTLAGYLIYRNKKTGKMILVAVVAASGVASGVAVQATVESLATQHEFILTDEGSLQTVDISGYEYVGYLKVDCVIEGDTVDTPSMDPTKEPGIPSTDPTKEPGTPPTDPTHEPSQPIARLEDFTVIVKVDGNDTQVSNFEKISHEDFLSHLSALTEAKLSEGLTYVSAVFEGNTAILHFTTPATYHEEWVDTPEEVVSVDRVEEWVDDPYVTENATEPEIRHVEWVDTPEEVVSVDRVEEWIEDTEYFDATGGEITVNRNDLLTEDDIKDRVTIPTVSNGQISSAIQVPSTKTAGVYTVPVTVTYPDGSTDDVEVKVRVIETDLPPLARNIFIDGALEYWGNNKENFDTFAVPHYDYHWKNDPVSEEVIDRIYEVYGDKFREIYTLPMSVLSDKFQDDPSQPGANNLVAIEIAELPYLGPGEGILLHQAADGTLREVQVGDQIPVGGDNTLLYLQATNSSAIRSDNVSTYQNDPDYDFSDIGLTPDMLTPIPEAYTLIERPFKPDDTGMIQNRYLNQDQLLLPLNTPGAAVTEELLRSVVQLPEGWSWELLRRETPTNGAYEIPTDDKLVATILVTAPDQSKRQILIDATVTDQVATPTVVDRSAERNQVRRTNPNQGRFPIDRFKYRYIDNGAEGYNRSEEASVYVTFGYFL